MYPSQFFLTSCTLLASSVSAAAMPRSGPHFIVEGFSAAHTPHSSYAYVSFNLTSAAIGFATTACNQDQVTQFANTVDNVPLTNCTNPAAQFSLIRNTGANNDFVLTVQLESAHGQFVAARTIPAKDDIFFTSPPGSGFEWEELKVKQNFAVHAAKAN